MKQAEYPDSENVITQLILSVFQVNGALLIAGDRLTSSIGLTSARWQVLGTIATSPTPLSVAHIAKSMGLSRQNIRVIVRELETAGMVKLAENPHHQRASLVLLTPKGQRATDAATALQGPFAAAISEGLSHKQMKECVRTLQHLLTRLREHNEQTD